MPGSDDRFLCGLACATEDVWLDAADALADHARTEAQRRGLWGAVVAIVKVPADEEAALAPIRAAAPASPVWAMIEGRSDAFVLVAVVRVPRSDA